MFKNSDGEIVHGPSEPLSGDLGMSVTIGGDQMTAIVEVTSRHPGRSVVLHDRGAGYFQLEVRDGEDAVIEEKLIFAH